MAESPDFSTLYDQWFGTVYHWARTLGGLDADLEDLTQEVFVVVRRKLSSFDGANPRGWLYRITARTVGHYRRHTWFRHFGGRARGALPRAAAATLANPHELLERAEARRLLYGLLDKLSERRREAFLLFELEGHSAAEIAGLLGIPEATVRTRVHFARKQFVELVAELRRRSS